MHPVQRIYITGFMGVGKSTVAPRVAKRLGYSSMDLDNEIVRHLGLSIPGIFEVMGERVFRETEFDILKRASNTPELVVSLGGGAICREETLNLCLETGLLIYLKSSPKALAARLSTSRQTRPKLFDETGGMLQGASLQSRIEELLQARAPFYESAHLCILVDGQNTPHIARTICQKINNWKRSE